MSAAGGNYRITFKRIGRNHNVAPLEAGPIDGPNHLAEVIYGYATPHLLSRDVEVVVDLEKGTGHILCGWNNGGTFTMAEEPPADDWPLPAVEIEDAEQAGLVVRPESPAAAEYQGGTR